MWIGDFVRCHTVVKLLKRRFPSRPIDVLTTAMVSPLLDYMPGVRKGIIVDLPRRRLALGQHFALAGRLRLEAYGQALVMPRTWKAALALYLAGIPQRTGFVGEGRFGLINDLRWGERRLPRMVERCAVLALPKGESLPAEWPLPELVASGPEVAAWRQRLNLAPDQRREIALAPGAVGPAKRWSSAA
jgi:heptosyltransferase-2